MKQTWQVIKNFPKPKAVFKPLDYIYCQMTKLTPKKFQLRRFGYGIFHPKIWQKYSKIVIREKIFDAYYIKFKHTCFFIAYIAMVGIQKRSIFWIQ